MQKITIKLQKDAIQYLKDKDRVLEDIFIRVTPPLWNFDSNYFLSLVESIVSQQLSIKAADAIFGRLKVLSPDPELTAEAVLKMDPQKMRSAGLSWSKVSYIKNIAEYVLSSDKVFEKFEEMSDEEIITELTKIKGVGKWTAEMFLIFTMGRPDVFSYGDLGLKRAIQKLYGFKVEPTRKELERVSRQWRPYRSIASRYLWKSLTM